MPSSSPEGHQAIVIGAGPAGLAAAAMLQREGVETLVLERDAVASSWRRFYDRLHLHTVRWLSGLPGLPIHRSEGRWVPRDGVVAYLERYSRYHRLKVRTNVEVRRIERRGERWVLHADEDSFDAKFVVIATGFNREPFLPDWPGMKTFQGELLHSIDYRNPEPYRGREVLVVGTGNSGAEIAVDLVEGGARHVMISVRTPPNILRRDVAGFPSQVVGVLARRPPVPVVDRVSIAMQRLTVGDLAPYGMPAPAKGLKSRANEDAIPILDVGLIDLVKQRRVEVVAAVEGFDGDQAILSDGRRVRADAVIAATGFRRGLEPLVGQFGVIGPNGRPAVHGPETDPRAPNLYFIGFSNPLSGNLREVAIDAKRIARAVRRKAESRPRPSSRGSARSPTVRPTGRRCRALGRGGHAGLDAQ
ncbi:MAG TPA: NAD(P)/FAD-dependent oxidoreductase [Actinomycetota bacterium]